MMWLWSEGKEFYKKKGGNNSMNGRKIFILLLINKLFFSYAWLFTNSKKCPECSSLQSGCLLFLTTLPVVVLKYSVCLAQSVVIFPSLNIPKVQGVRYARQFFWNSCADSILKLVHLCQLFLPPTQPWLLGELT